MFTQDPLKIEKIQERIVLLNNVMRLIAENNSNIVSAKDKLLEYCNIYAEIVYLICPKDRSGCLKNLLKPEIDLSCDKIFNAHLLASGKYIKDLRTRLDNDEVKDIKIERTRIFFDFLPLLKEINKRYPVEGLVLQSGKRQMQMSAKTARYTALNIFQGRFGDTSNYPYFTYFYSIFAIRQALELAGNEIIGLDFIRNSKNEHIHHFKLPWEFLKENSSNKFVKLPSNLNPTDVILVIDWANSFTHEGCDSRCYVVFEGLMVVDRVFQYQTKEVTTREGETENVREWSIVIYDYAKLKAAFEKYLQKQKRKELPTAVWKNNEKLATVLN
ncbi:MAG TPA: hypothetical protein VFL76_06300 [Edaphocola sp.]|nr:hypothetical protein [Edaphocola sp.]